MHSKRSLELIAAKKVRRQLPPPAVFYLYLLVLVSCVRATIIADGESPFGHR
jgi:hypothetical protein